MIEPPPRPVVAHAPISVILFASALSTETDSALLHWRHYLEALHRPFEIFLVRECRPEVSEDIRPDAIQPTRVFPYDRAVGWRDALNDAIRTTQNPLLAFCTCDEQFETRELDLMLKMIDQVDLVVGYRVGQSIPYWRLLLDTILVVAGRVLVGVPVAPTASWLGSEGWGRRWIARWIFGLRVNDPECPFRLARREVIARVPIQSQGSFAFTEMLAKANHLACLIAEEPVTWTPTPMGPAETLYFSEDLRRVFRSPDFGDPMNIKSRSASEGA